LFKPASLSRLLYTIICSIYPVGIRIAALWNPKARRWVEGRKGLFKAITASGIGNSGKKVWMHCASLGEFEQGRPLLEALRNEYPGLKIVLTFFSPSGYEVMKNYSGADHIFYLPMDSPENARRLIDLIGPDLVLWVKYEFWYHYLSELKRRNIPVMLVSGIFRKSQPFFRGYGAIWREMLHCFTHLFVQNISSGKLLSPIIPEESISVGGDTRFDRVIGIAANFSPVPGIAEFCGDHPVLVAGSTWEEDEVELLHYVKCNPGTRFIIAPHEVDEENLADVKKTFPEAVFYSAWLASSFTMEPGTHVLVIDNVGMLSRLYRYATVAFVGGGFNADGVHNVLEAAVYGKPVVFGPVYEKYDEALGLLDAGGGSSVNGPLNLEQVLAELMNNADKRNAMGEAAKTYVYGHAGATERVMRYIQEKRLLTS